MYYSRHGQDKYLNEFIFKNKKNGIFVELGAVDGIDASNTLFYERTLGWSGLCIEALPEKYAELIHNRTCFTENYAVNNRGNGEVEFCVAKNMSGIYSEYHSKHIKKVNARHKTKMIKVKTARIMDLFDKYSLSKIDYFSLDTEGSELMILKDIDFSKYDIKVFSVENHYYSAKNEIKELLESKGYEMIKKLEKDEIYLKQ